MKFIRTRGKTMHNAEKIDYFFLKKKDNLAAICMVKENGEEVEVSAFMHAGEALDELCELVDELEGKD